LTVVHLRKRLTLIPNILSASIVADWPAELMEESALPVKPSW
jgi:hypothetical protein